MIRIRKKTVDRIHGCWVQATKEWKIEDLATSHYFYVLLFGLHHMLMINKHENARNKLGDLMFTGALLDWYYQQNNDDFSPVLMLWRILGLVQAKEQYKNAIQNLHIQDPYQLYILRQVVEFIRDAFGKEIALDVSKASYHIHSRMFDDGYDLSESYRQLALALKSNQESKEALEWMKKALEIQRRVLHPDNPDLYVTLNSMASILSSLSMFEEAIQCYEEAIANRTRLLGAEHPKTLISIASYAFLLNSVKDFAKAKPYHYQVLINRKKLLGIEHPKTLNAMYNYANCLHPLGYLTQSLSLLKKCHELRVKVLGKEHRTTITTEKQYKKIMVLLKKAIEKLDPSILSTDVSISI